MDGIKLDAWKNSFNKKALSLQTEYNAFFQSHPLADCYQLEEDEGKQMLSLKITNDKLPKEIEEKLSRLLLETKPEDSV